MYQPQYYPGTTSVGENRRDHMSGELETLRNISDADIVTIMGHRAHGADYPSTHPPLAEMGEPDCPIRQLVEPTPGAAAGDRIRYSQFTDSMYNAPATPYWRSYWAAINCRGCDPGTLSGRQIIEARERDIEEYTKYQMDSEMTDPALSSMRGCTVHGHSLRLDEDGMMFDMLARTELRSDGNVYYVKDQLGIPLDKMINVGKPMNEDEAKKRTTIFRSDSVAIRLPGNYSKSEPDWWSYIDKIEGKIRYTTTYLERVFPTPLFCFYCSQCDIFIEPKIAFNGHPPEPCCPKCNRNDNLNPINDKRKCPQKRNGSRTFDEGLIALHHMWERRSRWGFRPE